MKNARLLACAAFLALSSGPALPAPPVVIEPVKASLDKSWVYEIRESRAKAGAPRQGDAQAIADDLARNFQATLDRTLRDHGFQIATGPSGATVRVVARLEDVYVSAPENTSAGVTAFTRQSGRATLRLEATDGSGKVLMRSEQRSDAGDTGRLQRATDVANRFWFEALFRDWSADIAKELKRKSP